MAHSSLGHVKISGTAMLANPRPIDPERGSRHLAFDANFNIVDGGKKPTLGLLRYFVPDHQANSIQKIMEDEFTQAFIVANISAIDPTSQSILQVITEDLVVDDYAFTGDIKELWLVQGKVDIKHRPYIDLLGSVTGSDTGKHTFNIEPSQYIAFMHNSTPFKAHIFISDSKHWGDKKPKPPLGTTVMIGGFFDEVKRSNGRNISTYEVELDDITYVSAQGGGSSRKGGTADGRQNRRSKTRFNFDSNETNVTVETTGPGPDPVSKGEDNTGGDVPSSGGSLENKKRHATEAEDGTGERDSVGETVKGKRKKVD